MPFFSIPFLFFLIVAFVAVWHTNEKSALARNVILLVLNAIFYAWWDWRTLPLLLIGSAVDYAVGRGIESTDSRTRKRGLLAIGLLNSLGGLLFFKYHNFFVKSLSDSSASIGISLHLSTIKLILPIGISFYTLLRVGYLLDVFRKVSKAEHNLVNFLAFASFFPVILSGPIERSTTLLVQLRMKNTFDPIEIKIGFRLFMWGAFKKIVVADSLARIVDAVFKQPGGYSGIELAIGVILFAVQLYCDFSGYSEMAMGIAQLLGFRLTRNFANPYFSRDIAEFWRRWHISFSTWLRDYVFFPLGAGYKGKTRWIGNILITYLVCGLWHGANWTFIVWGALMGIYFIPLIFFNPNPKRSRTVAKGRWFPSLREDAAMTFTFSLVTLSWIFFRSDSLPKAFHYLKTMFTHSWIALPNFAISLKTFSLLTREIGIAIAIMMVFLLEWIQRRRKFALDFDDWSEIKRWVVYAVIIISLMVCSGGGNVKFIYADF
jgi:alginate O-acetyltransferase complex protein AlgI